MDLRVFYILHKFVETKTRREKFFSTTIFAFCVHSIKWTGFSKVLGKTYWLLWALRCLTAMNHFLFLAGPGRGHNVFKGSKWQRSWSPKQASCDNFIMDEFSLGWTLGTTNWPQFFYYCYSNFQIFPAPRTPGPNFYLEATQTYFEDVLIIILCVFSSACLAPTRRSYLKRGRSRPQTPAQLCWARMFRYLGHDANKHSGVGFKRLRLPILNYPCKGGYNAIWRIGSCCLPGAAAVCQLGYPKTDVSTDSMPR